MTQEGLTNEIIKALEKVGYKTYFGGEGTINDTIKLFPAAWVTPLKLIKTSGVHEGVQTYKCVAKLMELNAKESRGRGVAWSAMVQKCDAVRAALIETAQIVNIVAAKVSPTEMSLTNRSEMSVNIEFEAEVYFNS